MARVLLTIADVGVAIDVQERLERAGHQVSWEADRAPGAPGAANDVIIVAGGDGLAPRIEGWRGKAHAPAVIVIGRPADEPITAFAEVMLVTSTAEHGGIEAATTRALARRFVGRITPPVARAALGLDVELTGIELAIAIIERGRDIDPAIVRPTLEPRIREYVWTTPLVTQLRERRALDVPELELLRSCTGATTITTVVNASSLPPIEAGQRLWSLACAEAIGLGSEPPDVETDERRRVQECRRHLRRRAATQGPTAYDILGVTRGVYLEDVENAVRALSMRYSPDVLAEIDIGDATDLATPVWEKILEARGALYYELGQKQLDAFIDAQPTRFADSWGRKDLAAKAAATSFARGQAALSDGEVFKAIADMAAAARQHPGHPVYECYLAWARYRVEVARGGDRATAASRERRHAEEHSYGMRPFAEALVALGLLCVADGDAAAARWHLKESLVLNPNLPAAKIVLSRLS